MNRPVLAGALLLLVCGCTQTPGVERPPESPSPPSTSIGAGAHVDPAVRKPARLRLRVLPGRLPQPVAREAVAPGAHRFSAVVAGGLVRGDTTSQTSYVLDLRTGRTHGLRELRTPVHDTAGSVLAGHAAVLGGGNSTEQSVVQQQRGSGWHVVGHLPAPRSDLTVVRRPGITYVVGGYDGVRPALAQVLSSRNGRAWTSVARLRIPVRYAAAAAVDGTLWVFGGEVGGRMVRWVQRIDLRTGRTRVAGRLPVALGHSVVVPLGTRLLLVGGRTRGGTPTSRMWWFRPLSRTFAAAGRLPTPLADSAALADGATAYLVGGEDPTLSDRILRLHWG